MINLECSATCNGDMDVDSDQQRLEAFEMWMWRRMERISNVGKVTSEE